MGAKNFVAGVIVVQHKAAKLQIWEHELVLAFKYVWRICDVIKIICDTHYDDVLFIFANWQRQEEIQHILFNLMSFLVLHNLLYTTMGCTQLCIHTITVLQESPQHRCSNIFPCWGVILNLYHIGVYNLSWSTEHHIFPSLGFKPEAIIWT